MPTVEQNREMFESFRWSKGGDEWSAEWGGTSYLWHGTIFPRIQAFVPTESILEIAPGFDLYPKPAFSDDPIQVWAGLTFEMN